ncbi:MAG: NUDIX hydrolase [Balneolaceae bacterium]
MHDFALFLKRRLRQPLPGTQAQLKMAPQPVGEGDERVLDPGEDANQSSVLVAFYPNEEDVLELLLTLRSDDIEHGGQISFPGGRSEAGEAAEDTALREAREEVGIVPEQVEILGRLSPLFVNHSNNNVIPVAGYLPHQPPLTLDPREVQEAFSIELDSLLGKDNLTVEQWELPTYRYQVPFWDVHRVPLWGATAMMLNEFLELYREYSRGS